MDIVVTIPKSEYENDDMETGVFQQGGYEQFWQLSKCPKKLNIGDRVYFIKHGCVESSMKVTRIEKAAQTKCDVTGRVWSGVLIFLSDLAYVDGPEVRGFRGFRYRWW